jgi:hypothetical protein
MSQANSSSKGKKPARARRLAAALKQADPQADAQQAKDTRAALRASREGAFGAWSTTALWAWGRDYGPRKWKLSMDVEPTRTKILAELHRFGAIAPETEEDAAEAWKRMEDPLDEYELPDMLAGAACPQRVIARSRTRTKASLRRTRRRR